MHNQTRTTIEAGKQTITSQRRMNRRYTVHDVRIQTVKRQKRYIPRYAALNWPKTY
jgi:hypothetical protein